MLLLAYTVVDTVIIIIALVRLFLLCCSGYLAKSENTDPRTELLILKLLAFEESSRSR